MAELLLAEQIIKRKIPDFMNSTYVNNEAAQAANERVSFSFGENWQKFIAGIDDNALRCAEESFVDFTKLSRLNDYEFLDIGCGSGMSSLVALRLGARRVVGVDVDPSSVAASMAMRDRFGYSPDRWQIHSGSVLDAQFLQGLGRFSYVYSWGVLHHTGAMWPAIENVVQNNIQPGGMFHLALYHAHWMAPTWLKVKRLCNASPHILFPLLKYGYLAALFSRMALRFESPIRYVRNYKANRGMSFFRDIDDWMGGLPYEFCSPEEVTNFMSGHGGKRLQLKEVNSCGCDEYLFQFADAPAGNAPQS
jgi:2-polyprenyl-6-hydroxyphenyl methylase/3-demethylubiquinone-9 3-methyltransferase